MSADEFRIVMMPKGLVAATRAQDQLPSLVLQPEPVCRAAEHRGTSFPGWMEMA